MDLYNWSTIHILKSHHLLAAANQQRHSDKILYVQADHFLVRRSTLYELAETFYKLGGKMIAFDEIHKYANWSMELKSIYVSFREFIEIKYGLELPVYRLTDIINHHKDQKQIKQNDNAYLALDDIEHGIHRRIPLWLFGFLY